MYYLQTIFRFLCVLAFFFFSFIGYAQAIYFDGHKAVQDSLNNTWLCSVPRDVFGGAWSPVVTIDSVWTEVTVNGQSVASGERVTMNNITGGQSYSFTGLLNALPVSSSVTFTWLPVIELNGEFGYDYVEGTVSVYSPDSTSKESMRAKLKWRGNTTNGENKHKRNYSIKFLDKNGDKKNRSFFGLRKDNHWKLDAGQTDMLRVRNRITSDLWLDMSRQPWYDQDSTVINGSRGRITEVILNGKYQGIYNMMEPVDRKQLGLEKYDTINHEFHGQSWKVEKWCRTATMLQPIPWSNNSSTWDGIEVSYPEFEDVNPTDWSTLANAITFIWQTDVNDVWQEHLDSLDVYFDMPIMQDYFILIAAMQLIDNECKNLYYSVQDRTINKRLTMTPWDLDMSAGAKSITIMPPEVYLPERPLNWISHLPMYAMFNLSERNHRQIVNRYWQLRDTWLNTDSLVARFQRVVDELEQCGAAAREEARWSGDSDINGKQLDISSEMEYIEDWIRRRMAYLDQNVFIRDESIQGDVNGDEQVSIADVTDLIDYLLISDASLINLANADVDGDGKVSIADVTVIIDYLLSGTW